MRLVARHWTTWLTLLCEGYVQSTVFCAFEETAGCSYSFHGALCASFRDETYRYSYPEEIMHIICTLRNNIYFSLEHFYFDTEAHGFYIAIYNPLAERWQNIERPLHWNVAQECNRNVGDAIHV